MKYMNKGILHCYEKSNLVISDSNNYCNHDDSIVRLFFYEGKIR